MSPAVIAVIVLVVAIGAYFLFFAKGKEESLPEKKEDEKKLPPKKDGPSLKDKLDKRHEDMAKPKADDKKAEPAASGKKSDEKKSDDAKPADDAKAEPADDEKKAEPAGEKKAEPAPEPKKEEPKKEEPKAAAAAPAAAHATRPGDVEGMRRGLAKSRSSEGFFGRIAALVTGKKEISPDLVAEIEAVLLSSDVGVKATERLLARIKENLSKAELADEARVWDALRDEARKILSVGGGGLTLAVKPTVVMMVGVNGAGKTTTIGKIATKLHGEGKKVVLAAGDTFRAAAVAQLEVWGKRTGAEVVKGKDGGDPAAVAFDAVSKAKGADADVVIVDTAGRLHTKTNLMDELKKIGRSAAKAIDGAPHETLLVIDATNGQNALAQAKQFQEAMPLTGIVLTKLDGTAKGGVILAICDELSLPVRYVGLGERADDLHEFSAEEYVEALLGDAGA